MAASGVELTIVVPTFQERDNIAPLVARLHAALREVAWEVVFVDDNSPDGTAEAVRAIAHSDPRVRVIQRVGRRGLSGACVEGMLSSSAPYVAVMDADLQHDESVLPEMLRRLRSEALDVVVGSRYVTGGSTTGLDRYRLLLSRVGTRTAQLLLGIGNLHDTMSGFFMLRRAALEPCLGRLSQQGFKVLLDILVSAPRPLKFVEVPYRFAPRQYGSSKLGAAVAWDFAVLILDKLVGRVVPARFLLFCLIGGTGVLVHLGVLAVLRVVASFTAAQTGAVVAAMTSNYALNNAITYRDQRLRGRDFWRGLLSFYLICAAGALANVGIARLIYGRWAIWWLAGLAGALAGAVWNYAATRLYTWNRPGAPAGD